MTVFIFLYILQVNGDAAVATYNDVQFNFSVANDGNGLLAFESVDQEALADLIRSLPLIDSASNVDKRKGSNVAQVKLRLSFCLVLKRRERKSEARNCATTGHFYD